MAAPQQRLKMSNRYSLVAMLAAKADFREEWDRLGRHIAQAQGLLNAGGDIGPHLNFFGAAVYARDQYDLPQIRYPKAEGDRAADGGDGGAGARAES